MASIRKMKKKIKSTNDEKFIKRVMYSMRLIKRSFDRSPKFQV